VNGETITRTLTVLPKDFGTVEVEAEEPAAESANAQFRSAIWRCTSCRHRQAVAGRLCAPG